MAFELIMNKRGGLGDSMSPGTASIHKTGRGRFVYQDLIKAGIKQECFILVDRDKKLIGLRKPNPEEGAATFRVGGKGACREISLQSAFKAIGLDHAKCVGRLSVHHKDGLIYIMPEVTTGGPPKKK